MRYPRFSFLSLSPVLFSVAFPLPRAVKDFLTTDPSNQLTGAFAQGALNAKSLSRFLLIGFSHIMLSDNTLRFSPLESL